MSRIHVTRRRAKPTTEPTEATTPGAPEAAPEPAKTATTRGSSPTSRAAAPPPSPAAEASPPPAPDRREVQRRPTPPPPPPRQEEMVDAGALEDLANMDFSEFAALMDGAAGKSAGKVRLEPGQRVTGTVVRIGNTHAFVELGTKSEATIAVEELERAEIGAKVTAFVLAVRDEGVVLSGRLRGAQAREHLESAAQAGIPIDGRVAAVIPGGFEVELAGQRAFCPVSQIDRAPGEDLERFVGRELAFRILEIGDRDLVVSHKVIQLEQAELDAEQLWESLAPDQELEGVVVSVQPYGAFVDLGGVQGLVHKSELSWDARSKMEDLAAPGQLIPVRVISVDREQRRVSLAARERPANPWERLGTDFHVGSDYSGEITHIADFGAFVELAPGLQGLVHISELAQGHVAHPSEIVSRGSKVTVRILGVDDERKRLQLSIRQAGSEQTQAPVARQPQVSLGTFADLFAKAGKR